MDSLEPISDTQSLHTEVNINDEIFTEGKENEQIVENTDVEPLDDVSLVPEISGEDSTQESEQNLREYCKSLEHEVKALQNELIVQETQMQLEHAHLIGEIEAKSNHVCSSNKVVLQILYVLMNFSTDCGT